MDLLQTQLLLLPSVFEDVVPLNIHEIFRKAREMSKPKKSFISEVIVLLKLIMVAPATNAQSERIFSKMKRIKTYLRSTMTNCRLNNLMVLSVHKELLDSLDLISVGNDFVSKNQRRKNMFGTFIAQDVLSTSLVTKKNVKIAQHKHDY